MNRVPALIVLVASILAASPLACRTASDAGVAAATELDVAAAYAAALSQEAPQIASGAYILHAAVGPGLADLRNHTLPPDSLRHPPELLRALRATGLVTRVCEPTLTAAPDSRCPASRGRWVASFSRVERAAPDTLEFVGAFGIEPDSPPNLPSLPGFGYANWYRAVRRDGTWTIVTVEQRAIS